MDIHALYGFLGRFFRSRRIRQFVEHFGITPESRILDVGGTPFIWSLLDVQPQLVLLNVQPVHDSATNQIIADGCQLPFRDKAFDVVYSNSVIEHLHSLEKQQRFAQECSRVGRRYYVQTPNKWFPIEPHYLAPFVHWLPRWAQRRLIRNFTLRGWLTRPSHFTCAAMVDEIRLLDAREMQQLFPNAQLWRERFLGLTKSLIVVKSDWPGSFKRSGPGQVDDAIAEAGAGWNSAR